MDQPEATYDLIILGSGAAGLTAATVAADEGLSVLVLEKSEWLGGTTALSGGAPWIPGNPFLEDRESDGASALAYLREVLGNAFDAARCEAYVAAAPKMIDRLGALGVEFARGYLPDYHPEAAEARSGRTIGSPVYDARRMKSGLLPKIRPALPQLCLFGTLQMGAADAPIMRNAFRSPKNFAFAVKMVSRFAMDLLGYGRTTRLCSGRALVARLVEAASAQGATIWTEAEVCDLTHDGGVVTGLSVLHEGRTKRLAARRGVVLATGGFGANRAMREQLVPMAAAGWSAQPESCTGDGLSLGMAAGGHMLTDNRSNALHAPMSVSRDRNGTETVFPHFAYDRHLPGSIIVGPDARRFVNEARDYQKVVGAMQQRGYDRVQMIGDARFVRTYGMGLAKPWPFRPDRHVRNGYLRRADTIEGLAAQLGLDPQVLADTVARFNEGAREGRDPEFLRGHDVFSRFMGDAAHKPSPTLAPIEEGPFYALELRPGDLSSFAGLETDVDGQVLGAEGRAIGGLYAVGLDMNPVARGAYPSGGFGLGPGMSFGYRAALHAAGKALAPASA